MPKTSRVFSDEGPYFEVLPPGMFGGPGTMVVAEHRLRFRMARGFFCRIYAGGQRSTNSLSTPLTNTANSLKSSKRQLTLRAPSVISPSGTKIGYVSVLKQHNIVFIHDVATGTPLKSCGTRPKYFPTMF